MSPSRAKWIGLTLGASAAVLSGLTVLPPPDRALALLGLVAQERSLWILAITLISCAFALAAGRAGMRGTVFGLGLLSAVLCLRPPWQAFSLARAEGLTLSWARFLHSHIEDDAARSRPETRAFADAEGQALQLDIYAPPPGPPARAIVVLHGGGWSAGDKGELSSTSAQLRDHGFAVFDAQYRLNPAPNWKTATGDVKCAVAWVRTHASEWNVDPRRITLLGRSAGGHLALLAAYAADSVIPSTCREGDTSVDSVIALYPPVDLAWAFANPNNQRVYDGTYRIERALGGTPDTIPEVYAAATPLTYVRAGSPPTLVIHGGADAFVSPQHAKFLDEKLEAAGVPHHRVIIPYAQHGFDYIFGGWSGQIAEAEIERFLDERR